MIAKGTQSMHCRFGRAGLPLLLPTSLHRQPEIVKRRISGISQHDKLNDQGYRRGKRN
jgi:hypothetical protein